MTRWLIREWGSFCVCAEASGRDVTPKGRKARAVIAHLASQPGTRIPKDTLIALLWGDRPEAQARGSLRQTLLEIRHAAGPDLVRSDRDHVWVDESRCMAEAPDESAPDRELFEDLGNITPEFDEWLHMERERRAALACSALEERARSLLLAGSAQAALPLIERMQHIDPYNEDAVRLAMRAEYEAGHAAGIRLQFSELAARLRRELGIAPSAQTRALHDQLLTEVTDGAVETQYVRVRPSNSHPPPARRHQPPRG